MKTLVLDNYDSFTYNLVHYLEKFTPQVDVYRNDQIDINEIDRYDKIVLSPGPGIPSEAGILLDVVKKYAPSKSILGVCLGQQAIAEAFGGTLVNLDAVFHGMATPIEIKKDDYLFKNIPPNINVGRYHSWVVDPVSIPSCLEIIATDAQNNIMTIRHMQFDVRGVQFHPESILTEYGELLIKNWIEHSFNSHSKSF